jgi:MerR family transcriptional regulator, thiopeptide resistance regulator
MKHFSSGEFARRAGVTVRTIRYYDRLGLLKPSTRSESGQRLYSKVDFARLQQILTLKLIGLSLDEIKHLLTTDQAAIRHLLERQRRVLTEQARQLAAVIQTIEQAQATLNASPDLDLETFISIIKAVNMAQQTDWLDQFYSGEQQEKLAALSSGGSLGDQKKIGGAWKTLFEDIQGRMDRDLRDPAVQQLVERWDALVGQVVGDDADAAANFHLAYAHLHTLPNLDEAPADLQAWTNSISAAVDFIQRARAAHK